ERDRHHQEHLRRSQHHRRGVALAGGRQRRRLSRARTPNNIFPWAGLKRRLGIEIRDVPARAGRLLAEDVITAIDARTRIVTLCEVSFSPGLRADLVPIGKITRAREVFLLVDGAQTAGIVHTDVEASGIDGLAVSTQKGLLGIYGMGFLYCRQAWA